MENNLSYREILERMVSQDNQDNPDLEFKSRLKTHNNEVLLEIGSVPIIIKESNSRNGDIYRVVFERLFSYLTTSKLRR